MERDTGRNLRWGNLKKQVTPWLTVWSRVGTVAGTLPPTAFGRAQSVHPHLDNAARTLLPQCRCLSLWVVGPAGPFVQACSQPERQTR